MKGNAIEQWGELTDHQLEVIAGKRDPLVGAIQKQYGHSKQRVEAALDRWARDSKSSNPERPSKH